MRLLVSALMAACGVGAVAQYAGKQHEAAVLKEEQESKPVFSRPKEIDQLKEWLDSQHGQEFISKLGILDLAPNQEEWESFVKEGKIHMGGVNYLLESAKVDWLTLKTFYENIEALEKNPDLLKFYQEKFPPDNKDRIPSFPKSTSQTIREDILKWCEKTPNYNLGSGVEEFLRQNPNKKLVDAANNLCNIYSITSSISPRSLEPIGIMAAPRIAQNIHLAQENILKKSK